MHQEQAADFFGEPRSRPARDRLEAYSTLRRGLVVRLIAPIHARSLCDFALRRLELGSKKPCHRVPSTPHNEATAM
jgi:hypothetical protein